MRRATWFPVRVLERLHPYDAEEGWVIGGWTDELGVEHVRVYEILRDVTS